MGAGPGPGEHDPLVQWLVNAGGLGAAPDYLGVVLSAKWAGVPAWDLAGLPHTAGRPFWLAWTDRVRRAMALAEHELGVIERRKQAAAARRR